MTTATSSLIRACGLRVAGGLYSTCDTDPFGLPLEHFLVDPPRRVDAESLGLAALGVSLITDPRTGVTHLYDIIGQEHYPNVADHLEETRVAGLSRRLPKRLDLSLLTAASRHVCLHARAVIAPHSAYYRAVGHWACPKHLEPHAPRVLAEEDAGGTVTRLRSTGPPETCAALYWEDVEGGRVVEPAPSGREPARIVLRVLPSTSYVARHRPEGITPRYNLGIYAAFPITRLVLIRSEEHRTDELQARLQARTSLPVELEDA